MDNTFIKLYRKIDEWEWYKDIPTKVLFFHLLIKVNFSEKKWQGREIKKGEIITSLDRLSHETGLSVMQVRTALNKLKSTNEITSKSTNTFTHIQLIKWEQYQINITSEQQTDNKRITTTKESKKVKKDTIPPIPLEGGGVDKEEKDFYTEGLNRIDNPKLREAAEKWYRYKKERKDTYKPIGWETLITLILKNDASLVIERIDEAISSGWKGINLATAQKNKNTTRRVEYYGILDEWIEPIRVLARNSLRDHETASRREADENTTRRLLYESVIKYYKQPGKLSEDESTAINEKVGEWRTKNKKESYESTPSDVIVGIIKDVLFKK